MGSILELVGANQERLSWRSSGPLVGLALVILLVGVVAYRVASGEARARADALRAELSSIQETNGRLARQNEQLSRDVAALRLPESLVQVARDNLGMARPGEVIYFVAP